MADEHTQTYLSGDQGWSDEGRPRLPGVVVLFSELPGVTGRTFAGQHESVLGRADTCDISLPDRSLSRQHARLCFGGSQPTITDEKSHNGTFLNGKPAPGPQSIPFGSVVRCGANLLLVSEDIDPFEGWPERAIKPPMLGGPTIATLRRQLDVLAEHEVEVLLLGETGAGKGVAAEYLHNHRQTLGNKGEFVAINCAEVASSVFETELFGARRGAFTGATRHRTGMIRRAHRGTLFLDEVSEIPQDLQAKLLQSLENRTVRPVGADRPVPVDFALVAATNRDLAREVEAGRFRRDLFYRIAGVTLTMPPLRDRPEDLVLLAQHQLAETSLAPTCLFFEALLCRPWPGNVRQLAKTVRAAVVQAALDNSRLLLPRHLPADSTPPAPLPDQQAEQLVEVLRQQRGNVSRAAEALGISRPRVYRLLATHRLNPADFRSGD